MQCKSWNEMRSEIFVRCKRALHSGEKEKEEKERKNCVREVKATRIEITFEN